MVTKFRKSPPICLGISIGRLLVGKLRLLNKFLGNSVEMEDGHKFKIFRHITIHPLKENKESIVFIVGFKFAKLSHKANKLASIIPMLLITGFPGFETKIYAVNTETEYWQGNYQWKSKTHLQEYKNSFVYKMMNKRAINNTIDSYEIENQKLIDYIEKII